MSTESSAPRDPLAEATTPAPAPVDGTTEGATPAPSPIPAPETTAPPAATVTIDTAAENPAAPSARAQVASEAKEALSSIASGFATLVSALFSFVLTVCPFVKRKAFRHGLAGVAWAVAFGCAWYAFGVWAAICACLLLYGATCLHLWQPPEEA